MINSNENQTNTNQITANMSIEEKIINISNNNQETLKSKSIYTNNTYNTYKKSSFKDIKFRNLKQFCIKPSEINQSVDRNYLINKNEKERVTPKNLHISNFININMPYMHNNTNEYTPNNHHNDHIENENFNQVGLSHYYYLNTIKTNRLLTISNEKMNKTDMNFSKKQAFFRDGSRKIKVNTINTEENKYITKQNLDSKHKNNQIISNFLSKSDKYKVNIKGKGILISFEGSLKSLLKEEKAFLKYRNEVKTMINSINQEIYNAIDYYGLSNETKELESFNIIIHSLKELLSCLLNNFPFLIQENRKLTREETLNIKKTMFSLSKYLIISLSNDYQEYIKRKSYKKSVFLEGIGEVYDYISNKENEYYNEIIDFINMQNISLIKESIRLERKNEEKSEKIMDLMKENSELKEKINSLNREVEHIKEKEMSSKENDSIDQGNGINKNKRGSLLKNKNMSIFNEAIINTICNNLSYKSNLENSPLSKRKSTLFRGSHKKSNPENEKSNDNLNQKENHIKNSLFIENMLTDRKTRVRLSEKIKLSKQEKYSETIFNQRKTKIIENSIILNKNIDQFQLKQGSNSKFNTYASKGNGINEDKVSSSSQTVVNMIQFERINERKDDGIENEIEGYMSILNGFNSSLMILNNKMKEAKEVKETPKGNESDLQMKNFHKSPTKKVSFFSPVKRISSIKKIDLLKINSNTNNYFDDEDNQPQPSQINTTQTTEINKYILSVLDMITRIKEKTLLLKERLSTQIEESNFMYFKLKSLEFDKKTLFDEANSYKETLFTCLSLINTELSTKGSELVIENDTISRLKSNQYKIIYEIILKIKEMKKGVEQFQSDKFNNENTKNQNGSKKKLISQNSIQGNDKQKTRSSFIHTNNVNISRKSIKNLQSNTNMLIEKTIQGSKKNINNIKNPKMSINTSPDRNRLILINEKNERNENNYDYDNVETLNSHRNSENLLIKEEMSTLEIKKIISNLLFSYIPDFIFSNNTKTRSENMNQSMSFIIISYFHEKNLIEIVSNERYEKFKNGVLAYSHLLHSQDELRNDVNHYNTMKYIENMSFIFKIEMMRRMISHSHSNRNTKTKSNTEEIYNNNMFQSNDTEEHKEMNSHFSFFSFISKSIISQSRICNFLITNLISIVQYIKSNDAIILHNDKVYIIKHYIQDCFGLILKSLLYINNENDVVISLVEEYLSHFLVEISQFNKKIFCVDENVFFFVCFDMLFYIKQVLLKEVNHVLLSIDTKQVGRFTYFQFLMILYFLGRSKESKVYPSLQKSLIMYSQYADIIEGEVQEEVKNDYKKSKSRLISYNNLLLMIFDNNLYNRKVLYDRLKLKNGFQTETKTIISSLKNQISNNMRTIFDTIKMRLTYIEQYDELNSILSELIESFNYIKQSFDGNCLLNLGKTIENQSNSMSECDFIYDFIEIVTNISKNKDSIDFILWMRLIYIDTLVSSLYIYLKEKNVFHPINGFYKIIDSIGNEIITKEKVGFFNETTSHQFSNETDRNRDSLCYIFESVLRSYERYEGKGNEGVSNDDELFISYVDKELL